MCARFFAFVPEQVNKRIGICRMISNYSVHNRPTQKDYYYKSSYFMHLQPYALYTESERNLSFLLVYRVAHLATIHYSRDFLAAVVLESLLLFHQASDSVHPNSSLPSTLLFNVSKPERNAFERNWYFYGQVSVRIGRWLNIKNLTSTRLHFFWHSCKYLV